MNSSYSFELDRISDTGLHALDQHKPLFGVHPLLLPFSHDHDGNLLPAVASITPSLFVHGGSESKVVSTTPVKALEHYNPEPFIDEATLIWTVLSTGKLSVQCQFCGQQVNTGSSVKNLGLLKAHVSGQ